MDVVDKPGKQNDDDDNNSAGSNDKENNGSDANAVSMIADLPIFTVSDDENEVHTKSPPIVSTNGSLPLLFSGNYFQIISRSADGTKAKCMAPNCGRTRTGTKSTTSNFITHLKVDEIALCFIFNRLMSFLHLGARRLLSAIFE